MPIYGGSGRPIPFDIHEPGLYPRLVIRTGPSRPREPSDGDLTTCLIAHLKQLIVEGVLTPGCKLPPERTLALKFGVSRPSLRQALKVLGIMGVVVQKVGDGTYLNTTAKAILDEPLSFLVILGGISHHELFELRRMVEPELAACAAERATLDDLTAMRRALQPLERRRATEDEIIKADLAFHEAISRASGNRLCEMIFSMIHRALLKSIAQNSQRDSRKVTLHYHRLVYEAIYAREPELARRRMAEHIREARGLLLGPGDRAVSSVRPASARKQLNVEL